MIEETNSELALVGLLMKQPDLIDHCQLLTNSDTYFSSAKAKTVFFNIFQLYNEFGKIDRRELMKRCQPLGVDLEFYSILTKSAGFAPDLQEYITDIYNRSTKQLLSNLGMSIGNCVSDDLNDASEYLKRCREVIEYIDKGATVTTGVTLPQAVQEVYDKIEKLQDDTQSYYIKTGIMAVDRIITGFERKTMSVIGARPSVGKTACAVTMMSNMMVNGVACGFISVEMSESQLIARMAQVRSGVSIFEFKDRGMNQQRQKYYTEQLNALGEDKNLQVVRTTSRKISNIRAIARKMKNNNPNLQVVFIDYLQKITGDDLRADIRNQVSQVSGILTDIATDMDIHVCALAQLNRDGDEAPKVKNLKESGTIEQDAHYILLLHRDLNDQHQGNECVSSSIAIAKNRDGMTGIANTMYHTKTTRFYDVEAREF
jgi:replicative DNA helicase